VPRTFSNEEEWQAYLVELTTTHGRLFHRLAWRVLKDHAASEDCCQQAFLKALERSKSLWKTGSPHGYLAKVVVNEALVLRRKRELDERSLPQRERLPEEKEPPNADWILRESAMDALEKLPEQTQIVVVLRVFEGLPGMKVAELLGMNESSVSREYQRGMNILRKLVKDW
jgi:RNA polymerase sigma-70 factor (ECF subfamily)